MNHFTKSCFRPSFETLESREMMSVTSATLSAGVLTVNLSGANDVRIFDSGAKSLTLPTLSSTVAPSTATPAPTLVNFFSNVSVTDLTTGVTRTFNRAFVQKIEILNNLVPTTGNNNIVSTSSLSTKVDLRATTGNSNVQTGAGSDLLIGGFGPNTMNAGGGNDRVFSANRRDIIDAGTGSDTVHARAGTVVRNAETADILEVPLGNPKTDTRATALQAANRFLGAYGLPSITHGIVLNDSTYGLTPSRELSLVREKKPNASFISDASNARINSIVRSGKPVLIQLTGHGWVVIKGVSATGAWTIVDKDGLEHTSTSFQVHNRSIIF